MNIDRIDTVYEKLHLPVNHEMITIAKAIKLSEQQEISIDNGQSDYYDFKVVYIKGIRSSFAPVLKYCDTHPEERKACSQFYV